MIIICPKNRLTETLPLGQRFFDLAGEIGQFNPLSFLSFWDNIYDKDAGVILVNETNGAFDGAYGIVLQNEFLTGEKVATEVFWYSEGSSGIKLFKKAQDFVEKCNVKVFYVQHLFNVESVKITNFYAKQGFQPKYIKCAKGY